MSYHIFIKYQKQFYFVCFLCNEMIEIPVYNVSVMMAGMEPGYLTSAVCEEVKYKTTIRQRYM